MIHGMRTSILPKIGYYIYVALFITYLFGPLLVTAILAFNNSTSPSFPWSGFTLDWFFSTDPQHLGIIGDRHLIDAVISSLKVASWVTLISVLVGINNAFMFERVAFHGKGLLYVLMMAPLVVPGVILGISILAFSNSVAGGIESFLGRGTANFLRPGFWLVVMGQSSFVATYTTLVITARLRKFDLALEEAAMDLGASRLTAIGLITLRFLLPAIVGGGIIAFLFSFENFNTTYFLSGPNPTLPVLFYSRLRFGITPQINAVSVMLMAVTGVLGIFATLTSRSAIT
jgi:spermidine/putrescine transport system permease protein